MNNEKRGWLSAALGVRVEEIPVVKPLALAASLLGFALVFFFSASNALFLTDFGADDLPWVYIANAPLVIAAGLGYSAWSRRSSVATVLNTATIGISASVIALWIWSVVSSGSAAAFAIATWYRFLFVFSVLGLWEAASAQFDVRQAKRLFPVVAVGMMAAFMVGGALVSPLTALMGTRHLIAVSALFFVLYAAAFARAVRQCDFSGSDNAVPATPREIVSDPFSRNLAILRSITILLIFVTEFIFYEQVATTFTSDAAIARFLGIFMAVGTLVMVLITALVAGRYITRFGVRVGLMTMPAGLMICALAVGVYGAVRGTDTAFFGLVIFANFASLVLANAIETPVGAVLFQPMSVERRMPIRVAVDGWLGSVALLGTGLLLLAFDRFSFPNVVPFAWLLAAIGAAGIWSSVMVHRNYRDALEAATTLAFSGTGTPVRLSADEDGEALRSQLVGDDPASVLALAGLFNELEDNPLSLILPDLAMSRDSDVATLALGALEQSPHPALASMLGDIASDGACEPRVRAAALQAWAATAPEDANVATGPLATREELDDLTRAALRLDVPKSEVSRARLLSLLTSDNPTERAFGASATPPVASGHADEQLYATLLVLAADADLSAAAAGLEALAGRLRPASVPQIVGLGRLPDRRRDVVQLLARPGELNVPEQLDPLISGLPESFVIDLIDDVYANQTRSPRLLNPFINQTASSGVRRAGFDAIRRADVNPPATVARMLRDDVEFARLIVSAHRDLTPTDLPLMTTALADEFRLAQGSIYAGLRLSGSSARISEVEDLIRQGDDESRANGIEALDNLLDTELRLLTIPVLEPSDPTEAALSLAGLPDAKDAATWLPTIVSNPRFTEPTRALAQHHRSGTETAAVTSEETENMSETIERIIALKRVDIFASLPYELLSELASVVEPLSVDAGQAIITAGEIGDELYALTAGTVRVGDDAAMVTSLSAGSVFGELAVLAPAARSATVTAQSTCELLVLSRSMLLALTSRRPEVMAEIAKVLATRLRNTTTSTVT